MFKMLTLPATVVLGRTTFEGLPQALKGRNLIVVTTTSFQDVVTAPSCAAALEEARRRWPTAHVAFAGGARVYQEVIDDGLVDRAWITEIDIDVGHQPGDVLMPEFGGEWRRSEHGLIDASGIPDPISCKLVEFRRN